MLENQKDRVVTKAARKAKLIEDPRSYITFAGHIYLRGTDRSRQRLRVFDHSKGKCAICGQACGVHEGDYDHIKGGRKHARCDCFWRRLTNGTVCTNVQWVHGIELKDSCHQKKHHRNLQFVQPWKQAI